MAIEDNFIVAIELGSSKVRALAGRKAPDGAIQVLASAQEPSESFIRKGRINNFNKMSQCVANLKDKLEKQLQKSISRVYVGVGGMGLHTVPNVVTRHFAEKTVITQEMLNSILKANLEASPADSIILEGVPQEYRLGAQTVSDPVGMQTENIEGHYLNIVTRAAVSEDISSCFGNAGVPIAGKPISTLQLADTMLTGPEKRSGCVFVDMGAETTAVAVYKNNVLRHLAVIPLGGANVNRDLCSFQIEDDEAEELKRRFGAALYPDTEKEHAPVALRDGRTVKFDDFSAMVEARMEEIILNVNNQIALSKYDKSQLIGGIVITGGAANMKDMDKAFERYTGFEKLRFVKSPRLQVRAASKEEAGFNDDGSYNVAIALMDKCELNCCGGDHGSLVQDIFEAAAEKETPAAGEAQKAAGPDARSEAPQRHAADEEKEPEPEPQRQKSGNGWFSRLSKRFRDLTERVISEDDEIKKGGQGRG